MAEKKASAGTQDQPGYECDVCGFRVLVDEDCGCAEEHVLLCCGEPMSETGGRKTAAKKPAARKAAVKKPAAKKGGRMAAGTSGARSRTAKKR